MKRKKYLGLVMAMALAGFFAPSISADAAGLTQALSPDQVNYGTVNETYRELLKSMFDAEYYLQQNPDLADLLGNDTEALFNHFCTLGVFEGRTCNANFDPAAYASAYSDLSAAYGTDILKYYEHYITVGAAENRNITTVAECAASGITVASLSAPNIKITPTLYKLASTMDTTNVAAIQTSLERAAKQASSSGSSVAVTSGDITIVIVPTDSLIEDAIESSSEDTSDSTSGDASSSASDVYSKAAGLAEKVGTITLANGTNVTIYIVKDSASKLGAYTGVLDEESYEESYSFIKGVEGFDDSVGVVDSTGTTSDTNVVTKIYPIVQTPESLGLESGATGDIPTEGVVPNIRAEDENGRLSADTIEGTTECKYNDFGTDYTVYNDTEGTASTEYTIGFEMKDNGGSVDVQVGISNSETGFAVYAEYDGISADESSTDDGE